MACPVPRPLFLQFLRLLLICQNLNSRITNWFVAVNADRWARNMLGCCRSFFGVLIYASHRFFFNFLTLRTVISAPAIALCLVSICLFESGTPATLAWAQANAPQSLPTADANPVGKVMTVSGSARIQHVTGVVVQANLPASGNGDAKIGDLIYRGDMI